MQNFDEKRSAVRRVLLHDWDPHNAARNESAHGSYDAYVNSLYDLIQSGADEERVMDWLHDRELETMCFPSLGKQRLRRIARLLIRSVREFVDDT
jgi:hypothetical protein